MMELGLFLHRIQFPVLWAASYGGLGHGVAQGEQASKPSK